MKGAEFLRKLQRLAKERGVTLRIDVGHGKGSHATLFYGSRRTTIRDRRQELTKGAVAGMLAQLGLRITDFEDLKNQE